MEEERNQLIEYNKRFLAYLDSGEGWPGEADVRKRLRQRVRAIITQLEKPSPCWKIIMIMDQRLGENLYTGGAFNKSP
jgi:hypothetical protein